jgi:hypothetical protein
MRLGSYQGGPSRKIVPGFFNCVCNFLKAIKILKRTFSSYKTYRRPQTASWECKVFLDKYHGGFGKAVEGSSHAD